MTRLHRYLTRLQDTILSRQEIEIEEIETYPHHKHIGDVIVAAQPPDLSEVLHEIDSLLYLTQNDN